MSICLDIDRAYTDETRVYDTSNRLTSVDNTTVGKASYTYDNNSNKLSETWDSVSNMAAWSFTTEDSGASTFTDGYDAEDRFRRFNRSAQSEDIYLDRSDIGNISDFKLNGTSKLRSYSDAHELTTVAGTAQQFDDDGNQTLNQHGNSFTWDEAGRMKQATVPYSSSVGTTGGVEYGYDATGKRVWKTVSSGVGDLGYGIASQDNASGTGYVMYSIANVHSRFQVFNGQSDHFVVVRHNGTSWQYDTNSNWVDFTSQTGDRLLADVDFGTSGSGIDSVTAITTLSVHAQGINQGSTDTDLVFTSNFWNGVSNNGEVGVAGTWFASGDSQTTVYIHSGPNCIAEYESGTVASSPDQEYVYADQIDSLVMIDRGSQELTVLRNQQWGVTALADASDGSVVERYTYDVFGKRTILAEDGSTIRSNSSYDNPYGYTSRRHDEETGLCFFRARYYAPTNGEFTSRDPAEYVDGMSLMRGYFGINDVDPEGEWIIPAACAVACIGGILCVEPVYNVCKDRPDFMTCVREVWDNTPWYGRVVCGGATMGCFACVARFIRANKVTKCLAIHTAYKALKCKGCKGCVTKDEAQVRATCLTAEVAGRASYLKAKCDYVLPGSIAKGSRKAERNHRTEVANKTRALAKCVAKSS